VIDQYFHEHALDGYILWQDNAKPHAVFETRLALLRLRIPTFKAPAWSLDLNLTEHVWTWMKNWIQEHYWEARYLVGRIPLQQLRQIILAAWNAVLDTYI